MLPSTAKRDQNGHDPSAQQHARTFLQSVRCCSSRYSVRHSLYVRGTSCTIGAWCLLSIAADPSPVFERLVLRGGYDFLVGWRRRTRATANNLLAGSLVLLARRSLAAPRSSWLVMTLRGGDGGEGFTMLACKKHALCWQLVDEACARPSLSQRARFTARLAVELLCQCMRAPMLILVLTLKANR
ncbi:hypothetical protein GQ600_26305 [Phytophthora cactorum]|nr:hypothetical protein GQ600_26305 [Phytophthora cactorum]